MGILTKICFDDSSHAGFVVNNQNFTHALFPFQAWFNIELVNFIENVTHPSRFWLKRKSPPCAIAALLAIARPSPVPAGLVVKNGSKIWAGSASAIAGPETSTSMLGTFRASDAFSLIVPPLGVASIAFKT